MILRIRSATYLMSVCLDVTFTVRKLRVVLVDIMESKLAGKILYQNFKIYIDIRQFK